MKYGRTVRSIARHAAVTGLLGVALGLVSTAAQAVPSFARQTGLPCSACHTVFPELTAFGREFKLNGYTLTGLKQIQASGAAGSVKINAIAPMSAMLQVGWTHVQSNSKVQPAMGSSPGQNNNFSFPQALSLYYAGEISPHMGSFVQMTYSQPDGSFGLDMLDVRYANRATLGGHNLIYGLTVDNMPGMEDVWDTTPAWTFPYTSSPTAPDNGIGQSQLFNLMGAGVGGYVLWDNHWYAAVSLYRSAPQGMLGTPKFSTPDMGVVRNVAPYWRVAWQGYLPNHAYLEVGSYGLYVKYAGTTANPAPSKFTDWTLDSSYQQPLNNGDLLSLHAVYLHENQTLPGGSNILQQFRADGSYELGHWAQASLGYFNSWGTPGISGTSDIAGFVAEADYLPWENTRLALQYTAYTKYAGSNTASDNNTLFLNTWFMW